ncbi:MAG: chemotaxis protein CheW [Chloroflexota bacterium]|nr:chemotaxis protein CheW [Chloroflexota bacterium]
MNDIAIGTERQLVVFNLGGEAYGVDIATVREIIQMQPVTTVPGTPHFVQGVINLRGSVIPVVDLRTRFGLEAVEHGKDTRIVVVNSKGQDIGIIVDSVAEVLRVAADSIEPPSSMITTSDSEYLLGILKLPDRLVILLDADRVLSRDEKTSLAAGVLREEAPSQVAGRAACAVEETALAEA